MERIAGLHHVSTICSDAQKNIDFYTGVLGLRLVKVTVNFDDPHSYHLYYGDELGRPGSALTFFSWPRAHQGRIGPPQATVTAFSVPKGALAFWRERLGSKGIAIIGPTSRFGDSVIELKDHDGTRLELVEPAFDDPRTGWTGGGIDAAHAMRGFHSVTLAEEAHEHTSEMLVRLFGFEPAGEDGNRFRYVGTQKHGGIVDVLCTPDAPRGSLGAGVVHHVAFRTADDEAEKQWRQKVVSAKFNVSPIMDRFYFRSIYFREPGEVLFEVATDAPGFTVDEPLATLGRDLKLPNFLEPKRKSIEATLPRLEVAA